MSDVMEADWFSAEKATFGDRLAGAREAAGLSEQELAQRLGVKTRVIEQWEEDQKEPRANRLQMMAGMLNVSIMWLLTGEGDGIAAPDEGRGDLMTLLTELRQLRGEMSSMATRMGVLEKRLRRSLETEAA